MEGTDLHLPHQSRRRVIVIGWDGASFELAQRWIDEGHLPALARLRERGAYGRLASTIPPVSAPAWTTFITGNNPGRHGIYYFKEHIPGTYDSRLTRGSDRRTTPLWRMLNEQDRTMGAINLVMTYPPEPLDGFMISGMDTPSEKSEYTYPPSLKEELLRQLGEYIIEPSLEEDARNFRYGTLWKTIWHNLENSIAAAQMLFHEKEWDVFVVNFRATDSVQHHFWKFMDPSHPQHDPATAGPYRDAILKVYRRLDEFVGEIDASLRPNDTLIVMSDHGFGPTSNKDLYLNNWLAEQGWLKYRRPPWGGGHRSIRNSLASTWWKKVWVKLRQITPQRAKDMAERLFPSLYQRIRYPAAYFFIDWPRTQAYADEYQESIWINLIGREPQGTVQPGAEYEHLRHAIAGRLRNLRDSVSGELAIEAVYLREEIYHGTELARAPDLIVIPRQDPYFRVRASHTSPSPAAIRTLTAEELRREYLPNGTHRLYGMFYAKGPGIAAGRQVEGIRIMDMAPTILHLAGCRVPSGLDGRVMSAIFERAPQVEYYDIDLSSHTAAGGEYDTEEEKLIAQKLRGLGYLG